MRRSNPWIMILADGFCAAILLWFLILCFVFVFQAATGKPVIEGFINWLSGR